MDIQGFENYLIYPDGKVTSKRFPKRYLKPRSDRDGYLQVNLCKDKKSKTHKIHRLVGIHYIPNPENKICLDHINRDKKDNRVENLRWVTPKENSKNTGCSKNNKAGFKYISETKGSYRFRMTTQGINIHSKNLSKMLCYSFFYLLKHPL